MATNEERVFRPRTILKFITDKESVRSSLCWVLIYLKSNQFILDFRVNYSYKQLKTMRTIINYFWSILLTNLCHGQDYDVKVVRLNPCIPSSHFRHNSILSIHSFQPDLKNVCHYDKREVHSPHWRSWVHWFSYCTVPVLSLLTATDCRSN